MATPELIEALQDPKAPIPGLPALATDAEAPLQATGEAPGLSSAPVATPHEPEQTPAPPQEPELSLEGLPDPRQDDKAYNVALAKRIKAYNADMRAYERAAPEPATLWGRYGESHPAYTQSEAKVRAAAGIAIERMAASGVDALALMERNPEEFFRRVNEVYDKEFGPPAEPAFKEQTTMTQPPDTTAARAAWARFEREHPDLAANAAGCKQAAAEHFAQATAEGRSFEEASASLGDGVAQRLRAQAADEDDGRSAGLFGGQVSGNRPTVAPQTESNFSEELSNLQESLWERKE